MPKNLTIFNSKRGLPSRALLHAIKQAVLNNDYRLTLIFSSKNEIKKLNNIYRNKEKATDILSFPLSKREGEIYICPDEARKEAKKFDRSFMDFILFLFIHGCVHLKGYDHGCTMESVEIKFRKRFKLYPIHNGEKYNHRH